MQTKAKKIVSIICFAVMCFFTAILVFLSGIFTYVAFFKTPENTAQIFGYKIFLAEEDIEGTDIKGGSLAIVKNTSEDASYTPQTLSDNTVLVIRGAGDFVSSSMGLPTVCVSVVFILVFSIVILTELHKMLKLKSPEIKDEENPASCE